MPDGFAGLDIIETRFLNHLAAGFDQLDLPLDFVLERHFQKAERIQILHFRFGAELRRAAQPHRNVGITAQLAFLHVAIGNADVLQHLLDLGEIGVCFVGERISGSLTISISGVPERFRST